MAYRGSFNAENRKKSMPITQGLFTKEKDDEKWMSKIMEKIKAIDLESDDLLMLLILYLMYRESGDKDLLIMMGALLFG